jgi:hypothetical protein
MADQETPDGDAPVKLNELTAKAAIIKQQNEANRLVRMEHHKRWNIETGIPYINKMTNEFIKEEVPKLMAEANNDKEWIDLYHIIWVYRHDCVYLGMKPKHQVIQFGVPTAEEAIPMLNLIISIFKASDLTVTTKKHTNTTNYADLGIRHTLWIIRMKNPSYEGCKCIIM